MQVKENLIEAVKESISQGQRKKPVLEKYCGGQAGFRWLRLTVVPAQVG